MKNFTPPKKFLKNAIILLTVLFSLIPFFGYSTHIVGGELNYKCLGGNVYEIRLRVYRDCYTGVPPFDNPAVVGIFGSNNVLITKVLLNFPGSTKLPPTLAQANPCIKTPTNICVEVAEYVGTVTLPPRVGGYQLAYQRCCRNPTIDNLTNPGNQGATYYAVVPDPGLGCNSNPVFKNWPPIFVCANSPIVFDHSATDGDGDSIHYDLCTPFTGATSGSAQPNPPSNPPYSFITWKAPYNATDPLGGVPLNLNPKTGLLTGIPNNIGQYVVGVCASEYRNGVLLSTTKRDFQFNVVACQPDVSAAAASFLSDCSNHTVTFTNNSSGSSTFHWNFGDNTTLGDTSKVTNPTYTYPSIGTYTVTLIAFNTSNPQCNDTTKLTVVVDTCKPCGMTLAIAKTDATCGGACTTVTPVVGAKTMGVTANSASNITWNHTMAGTDRFLLVEIATLDGFSLGVTYAGQPLTFLGNSTAAITGSPDPLWIEMYYLVNPPLGTNAVVVSFSTPANSSGTRQAHAITITGVNQTSPLNGIISKASGNSCPASSNIPSGVNELVVDFFARDHDLSDDIQLLTGQTGLYLEDDITGDMDYISSTKPGAAGSVAMGYDWANCPTNPYIWTKIGISIKPACSSSSGCTATQVTLAAWSGNTKPSPDPCPGTGINVWYINGGDPSGGSNQYYICGATYYTISSANWSSKIEPAGNACPGTGSYVLRPGNVYTYLCPCVSGPPPPTPGTATVTPSGGTAPYNYSWSPGGATGSPANLPAGTYTVTVVDANNCKQTAAVTIDANSTIALTPSQINPTTCGSSDGSASVSATGGTGPLTYLWNTNSTNDTITGLSAGIYTVKVVDSAGCSKSVTITIASPSTVNVTATMTGVKCKGGSSGTVTANPTGGSAPYGYSWTTSPAQLTQTATGLKTGYYVVTVTDANSCKGTVGITVVDSSLTVSSSFTDVKCNGGTTGTATISATKGSGGFLYSWNTVPVQTTPTAINLPIGTYTGVVTDAAGCKDSVTVTLTEPAPLIPEPKNTSTITCGGTTTGSAEVSVSGGTGQYTYLWCNGQSTTTATGLSPGYCTITVTDSNLCVTTDSILIVLPSPLSLTHLSVNLSCYGNNSGAATVNPSGGQLPYTYAWSTSPAQVTQTATGLPAGTYTVVVTDAAGCTASLGGIVITEPPPIIIQTSTTDASCNASTGTASATASGGAAPTFTYSWNTSPVQNGPTATGLAGGTYIVTATDANGCSTTKTATVNVTGAPTLTPAFTPVSCNGGNNGTTTVTVTGGSGTYTYSWNSTPAQLTATATGLVAGTYIVTVMDGSCSYTASVAVTQPTAFVLTPGAKTNITCNGLNNGTGTVTPSGGNTGTVTATWAPSNKTGLSVTGLSLGTYTVTGTDSKGCTATTTVTITQPNPISLAKDSTVTGCSGQPSGTATVTASGGTIPYSYSWTTTPVQTLPTATGLGTGVYTVTVTDNNSCTATAKINVMGQGNTAVPNFSVAYQPTCLDGVEAAFTNLSTGASTYLWYFGDGSTSTAKDPAHLYAYGKSYTVMLIAYNGGCSDTMTLNITINPFAAYISPKIPNVFTPNGDGVNDCFEIKVGNGLENCVELMVFDRWGLKMYDNENGSCWDGRTPSGKVVPDGTYYYIITLGENKFHGTLSVMR